MSKAQTYAGRGFVIPRETGWTKPELMNFLSCIFKNMHLPTWARLKSKTVWQSLWAGKWQIAFYSENLLAECLLFTWSRAGKDGLVILAWCTTVATFLFLFYCLLCVTMQAFWLYSKLGITAWLQSGLGNGYVSSCCPDNLVYKVTVITFPAL